jgi:hypothetical protein
MAFSPPNTFVAGTTLTAADVEGNNEALRVYLHGAIPSGDVANDGWIDTRHVQPPVYSPFEGLQHGVTGHQGGQWSGGPVVRLNFLTKYLTGNGVQRSRSWQRIPNTSFTVQLQNPAFLLFHYWYEVEVGPDNSTGGDQTAQTNRQIYIGPYVGTNPVQDGLMPLSHQQETSGHTGAFRANPIGANFTYPVSRGYGQRDGTIIITDPADPETFPRGVGQFTIGLCGYSTVDRAAIVNWSVALETFYL